MNAQAQPRQQRQQQRAWLSRVDESPLCQIDPRVKLLLSLGASLAVIFSLPTLLVFMGIYLGLMGWAKLLPAIVGQIWRIRWILLFLFALNLWLIDWTFAVLVLLRLLLLTGTFTIFFATTTIGELRLTLEWLRIPYQYAFGLSLAFQSITLLEHEWRTIREAQQVRGVRVLQAGSGWRAFFANLLPNLREMVALIIPAIVLTTQRAWSITEAAYARGFDAPHRRPYYSLTMRRNDWLMLAAIGVTTMLLVCWEWWR
jgi:energy-coupling factor transport system permease protein